jgi:hypothetical protein
VRPGHRAARSDALPAGAHRWDPALPGSRPDHRSSDAIEGAAALKQEAQHDLSPTEKLQALQWSKTGAAAAPSKAERRAEAKTERYDGRDVRRMQALLARAERDVHEVRYVWVNDGLFVSLH